LLLMQCLKLFTSLALDIPNIYGEKQYGASTQLLFPIENETFFSHFHQPLT